MLYKTCEQKPKGIETASFSDVRERKFLVEKLSSTEILRLGHAYLKKSKEQGEGCGWCMVSMGESNRDQRVHGGQTVQPFVDHGKQHALYSMGEKRTIWAEE